MIVEPRNEKIISIYHDIRDKEIDLRPNFQRGEVWSVPKKKLLIDTIFRGWHIPPVHLVRLDSELSEVLDGQQRLTAIRDFIENKFSIDGKIEPVDEDIYLLHGKKYKNLDEIWKRKFDKYVFSVYEIKEYNHGEPGELFHRLNQAVKLTSAEQRNAFYGEIRNQVSSLVRKMTELGVNKNILGFSNSRMAYNDLVTRVCYLLESNSLRAVVNDKYLNSRFRDNNGFSDKIINSVLIAIKFLSDLSDYLDEHNLEFSLTKASSLNWIYFIANESFNTVLTTEDFNKITISFISLESTRTSVKNNTEFSKQYIKNLDFEHNSLRDMLLVYIERSSSRVMTTASILIRDIIINITTTRMGYTSCVLSVDEKKLLSHLLNDISHSHIDVKSRLENMTDVWKN